MPATYVPDASPAAHHLHPRSSAAKHWLARYWPGEDSRWQSCPEPRSMQGRRVPAEEHPAKRVAYGRLMQFATDSLLQWSPSAIGAAAARREDGSRRALDSRSRCRTSYEAKRGGRGGGGKSRHEWDECHLLTATPLNSLPVIGRPHLLPTSYPTAELPTAHKRKIHCLPHREKRRPSS